MNYNNKKPKQLTTHDLAFGIGRKATKEELEEILKKPTGKGKNAKRVIAELKLHLEERRNRRKAS